MITQAVKRKVCVFCGYLINMAKTRIWIESDKPLRIKEAEERVVDERLRYRTAEEIEVK